MIETWILTFLYAWKKKLNIKLIFCDWPIYFPLICLIGYIIFEVMIFNDQYWITQYGSIIKPVTLLSYFGLMYKYDLYQSMDINKNELIRFFKSPFMVAIICLVIGYGLNFWAISANSGHMPVYPSYTYFTGYTDVSSFTENSFYILGDHTSKVIPLCDTIDIFYSNLSLGDVFVRIYVAILIYFSIKRVNEKYKINININM